MKHLNHFEEKLREKLPSMRSEFRGDLRAHLLEKAEHSFSQRPWVASVLSFISNIMKHYSLKRYSLSVLAILTLAVFTLSSLIHNPLEPEAVLAKMLENYDSQEQEDDIYHKKILQENYIDGQLESSTLHESYRDNLGNSLEIDMDPKTEHINWVNLTKIDSFGDVMIYENKSDSEQDENFFDAELQKKLDILKGEKVYCVEGVESEYHEGKVFLILAAEDYSAYQVTGWTNLKAEESYRSYAYEKDIDKMFNLNEFNKATATYIQGLIEGNKYDYSKIKEVDHNYYLFKVLIASDQEYHFYIDANTYQIAHYEVHYPEGETDKVIKSFIIANEWIDPSERAKIFNPNQFEILGEGRPVFFEGETLPFKVGGNGCFDSRGGRLEDDFFEQLSMEVKKSWNETIEGIQSSMKMKEELLVKDKTKPL